MSFGEQLFEGPDWHSRPKRKRDRACSGVAMLLEATPENIVLWGQLLSLGPGVNGFLEVAFSPESSGSKGPAFVRR
jgi:hypothetical protein